VFCGKICDETGSNPQGLCTNLYDRLGCEFNAPNNAEAGVFEAVRLLYVSASLVGFIIFLSAWETT
jgi:hypothetical protein